MHGIHTIRLRGPWEFIHSDGVEGRLQLPADWRDALPSPAPATWPHATRFRRSFHRPTGLAAGQAVDLVIEAFSGPITVRLNDQLLGTAVPPELARFALADQLQLRNGLEIELQLDPATACPIEVRLEIHAALQSPPGEAKWRG